MRTQQLLKRSSSYGTTQCKGWTVRYTITSCAPRAFICSASCPILNIGSLQNPSLVSRNKGFCCMEPCLRPALPFTRCPKNPQKHVLDNRIDMRHACVVPARGCF